MPQEAAAPAEPLTPAALGMIVFPAGQQSREQQAADESYCSQWAQEQLAANAAAQTEDGRWWVARLEGTPGPGAAIRYRIIL